MTLIVRAETDQAERGMKRAADTTVQAGQRTNQATAKMSQGFTELQASVFKVGLAVGAIAGGIAVIDRLADRAQKVTNLSTAFETLGLRIDANAETFLPKLRAATLGTVSDMELMEKANNAVILGVAKSEEQFAEFANIAIVLGRAVGLTATRALESFTTGVGRQSRLMLDNLGIIVDTEEAYRKYATTLGLAVDDLSAVEQKQAFLNESMIKARAAVEGIEPKVGTLGDAWARMATGIKNSADALLDFVNNAPEIIQKEGVAGFLERFQLEAIGGIKGVQGFAVDRAVRSFFGGGPDVPTGSVFPEALAQRRLSGRRTTLDAGPAVQPGGISPVGGGGGIGELGTSAGVLLGDTEAESRAFFATLERRKQLEKAGMIQLIEARMLGLEENSQLFGDLEMELLMDRQALQVEQFEAVGADTTELLRAQLLEREALEQEFTDLLEGQLDERLALEEKGAAARDRIAQLEFQRKMNLTLMTVQLVGQSLSTIFNDNRAAAIANAIVNTALGVTQALTLPFPLNFIVAGLVAAAGAVQVATIAGTSIGGGGGGGGGFSGGGGATTRGFDAGASPGGPDTGAGGLRPIQITVFLEGQGFIQDQDEFTRQLGLDLSRQLGRAGTAGVGDV